MTFHLMILTPASGRVMEARTFKTQRGAADFAARYLRANVSAHLPMNVTSSLLTKATTEHGAYLVVISQATD